MLQGVKWPEIDLSQFKLIISDIDGTLKDVLQPLDPQLKMVIDKLREAGIEFTVATGKNMKATRETAQALDITLPLILSNGAVIQDLGGRIFQKYVLPDGFVDILIEICETERIELAIHIDDEIYVRKITDNVSILFDYGLPNLIEVEKWENVRDLFEQANKCIAIDQVDRQRLFSLEKIVRSKCGASVEYCQTLVEMLEFMPKGVSKANSIRALTKRLGISMSEVLTMGDGNNDVGMLQEAGFGLAMANGTQAVRDAADWIIPSCAEHGPLEFLQFFLSQISQLK